MTDDSMRSDGFAAALEFLDLDDQAAGIVFGVSASDIAGMKSGAIPVPFLVSLATVLMCESPKATKLALEHGLASRAGAPNSDLIAGATGVVVKLKGRPTLRLVKDEPDEHSAE